MNPEQAAGGAVQSGEQPAGGQADPSQSVSQVQEQSRPESRREAIARVVGEKLNEASSGGQPEEQPGSREKPPAKTATGRNERGQFVPKSSEPAQPATEGKGQQPQAGVTEERRQAPIPVPSSWPAEARKIFATLPRELQEVVAGREAERERFLTEERQGIRGIDEAIKPYRDDWARRGVRPEQVIQQHFAWADYLNQNPVEAILALAEERGVMAELAGLLKQGAQPQQQRRSGQPQTELEQRLARIEQSLTQRERSGQQERLAAADREIEAFQSEVGQDGQLLRPYWNELEADLMAVVPLIRRQNPTLPDREVLAKAYTIASSANPKVAEAMEMERKAREEAKRVSEAKQRVEAARRMGSSVSGAPNGSDGKAYPKDRREMIRAVVQSAIGA